ncbi:MAG TPA: hypothetical protein VGA69_03010 [Nitriliruptorales bacterium]
MAAGEVADRALDALALVDVPDDLVAGMDNAPGDRHVLAAAVGADAQPVITANTADFQSPRFVGPDRIAIEAPGEFLATVLDEQPDLMATAPWQLASNEVVVTGAG